MHVIITQTLMGITTYRYSLPSCAPLGRSSLALSAVLKWNSTSGSLPTRRSTSDIGEVRESIPVDYRGPSVEVGFNSRYLLDFQVDASSAIWLLVPCCVPVIPSSHATNQACAKAEPERVF
ncbi:MAG: hypothetical protein JO270_12485 [Acidobacteriaceae bacterium]|nr:hypothetical protein [Acidobacteriaceae bacterium]